MADSMISWISNRFTSLIDELGGIAILTKEIFHSILTTKIEWNQVLYQLYQAGSRSQGVILITGAFTGMVLATQTYFQFHTVKMDTATLAVVGVAMTTELGPVLTGLMVAGRVGAAFAAELGTMRVTEQIDALRTLATHPVDFLVVPRIIALLTAMPLLTAEAMAFGILAGYIVGVYLLGIDPTYSWHHMIRYTDVQDLTMGIVKSAVFGFIVALIGCYKGLNCPEGAEGVGHATTEAVVSISIAILITNFFLTLGLGKLLGVL